ncbi:MAG: DNA gyrase inhibitor YacG [Alphaproteobacteria bacterium]|nr:DNA gyrase inhibitor YacG [Alphaproteobacteria bacterium]
MDISPKTSQGAKCPVCGAPMNAHYKPFCSKHCADVDLNRWFTGNYVVHTNEQPTEEDLVASVMEQKEILNKNKGTLG